MLSDIELDTIQGIVDESGLLGPEKAQRLLDEIRRLNRLVLRDKGGRIVTQAALNILMDFYDFQNAKHLNEDLEDDHRNDDLRMPHTY